MSVEREKPRSGLDWAFNARMHEDNRVRCLELAERYESAGEPERAAEFRGHAEQHRRERDRIQRDSEMQTLNRRAHRRRMY